MSQTGDGRRMSSHSDSLIQRTLEAEAQFCVLEGLCFALSRMVGELAETPGAAALPAAQAAEVLAGAVSEQLGKLHEALEAIFPGRAI